MVVLLPVLELNQDSTEKLQMTSEEGKNTEQNLNKILVNQIQQYIGRVIYHNQMGLILEIYKMI